MYIHVKVYQNGKINLFLVRGTQQLGLQDPDPNPSAMRPSRDLQPLGQAEVEQPPTGGRAQPPASAAPGLPVAGHGLSWEPGFLEVALCS